MVGVPPEMQGWSFETFVTEEEANRQVCEKLQRWTGAPPGVLLWGPAGLGKTGLLVSRLRREAECREGSLALWNFLTFDSGKEEKRKRSALPPAPVWFESWDRLRARLMRAPLRPRGDEPTVDDLLDDLDEWVAVLGIDDLDVDECTPWKETILLRLLRRVDRGQLLLLTVNRGPEEFRQVFGERVADRLLSPSRFALYGLVGSHSLRR